TALPTIASDLGRLADVSWVVSAYVVAAAASTPLWGKLGDRHGRKRLLEVVLVMFLAASAFCGLAQDITVLIVPRAVPGAAAGGDPPAHPLDVAGAGLLAGATGGLMLACVWGAQRYAWDSPVILGLIAATLILCAGLVHRERRAPDPIVPLDLLRTRTIALA